MDPKENETKPPINRWVNDKCIYVYVKMLYVYMYMYVIKIYTCKYFKTLFI